MRFSNPSPVSSGPPREELPCDRVVPGARSSTLPDVFARRRFVPVIQLRIPIRTAGSRRQVQHQPERIQVRPAAWILSGVSHRTAHLAGVINMLTRSVKLFRDCWLLLTNTSNEVMHDHRQRDHSRNQAHQYFFSGDYASIRRVQRGNGSVWFLRIALMRPGRRVQCPPDSHGSVVACQKAWLDQHGRGQRAPQAQEPGTSHTLEAAVGGVAGWRSRL